MIAAKELELTTEIAQEVAKRYISEIFGDRYFIEKGKKRDYGWNFAVQIQRDDISSSPMVGRLTVCNDGKVQVLSDDQIRDMKESAEVYAARERGETVAKDEDGYVFRYHARIKASCWVSDNVGMKIGAEGGIFLNLDKPIWRFTVHHYAEDGTSPALDVIDVDALSGQVHPLSQDRMNVIAGGTCAARRIQKQTAEAVQ